MSRIVHHGGVFAHGSVVDLVDRCAVTCAASACSAAPFRAVHLGRSGHVGQDADATFSLFVAARSSVAG